MKKISIFALCLGLVFVLSGPAHAVIIDLDASFETAENDGIIHFGDQTISNFVDTTADYNNATSVAKTFMLTSIPTVGADFTISMDHYQASYDAGYNNYFSINGTAFDYLEESSFSGHTATNWYNQIFTGSNSLLKLGLNDIVFYIDSSGSNQDDFEITNFNLEYAASGTVPEPSTLLLFGMGAVGAFVKRRLG